MEQANGSRAALLVGEIQFRASRFAAKSATKEPGVVRGEMSRCVRTGGGVVGVEVAILPPRAVDELEKPLRAARRIGVVGVEATLDLRFAHEKAGRKPVSCCGGANGVDETHIGPRMTSQISAAAAPITAAAKVKKAKVATIDIRASVKGGAGEDYAKRSKRLSPPAASDPIFCPAPLRPRGLRGRPAVRMMASAAARRVKREA